MYHLTRYFTRYMIIYHWWNWSFLREIHRANIPIHEEYENGIELILSSAEN